MNIIPSIFNFNKNNSMNHRIGILYNELEALKAFVLVLNSRGIDWDICKNNHLKRIDIYFQTSTHEEYENIMYQIERSLREITGGIVEINTIKEV